MTITILAKLTGNIIIVFYNKTIVFELNGKRNKYELKEALNFGEPFVVFTIIKK
ncbi:MAG: hypothetical protein M3M88_06580 [Thermoproteota archaeon]|nr:hypothetical protein [Thermoproteota archaeon]